MSDKAKSKSDNAAPTVKVEKKTRNYGNVTVEAYRELSTDSDGNPIAAFVPIGGQPKHEDAQKAIGWLKDQVSSGALETGVDYRIVRVIKTVTPQVETRVSF